MWWQGERKHLCVMTQAMILRESVHHSFLLSLICAFKLHENDKDDHTASKMQPELAMRLPKEVHSGQPACQSVMLGGSKMLSISRPLHSPLNAGSNCGARREFSSYRGCDPNDPPPACALFDFLTSQRRRRLVFSFVPCAPYARLYLTCC